MSNIDIMNKEVFRTILKAVKKNQTGLKKIFLRTVSEEEAKKLTILRFKKINISSLDFLRYFPNLETLGLHKVVEIKDTSGFAYCCNLKNLEIYDSFIGDFQPLTYCSKLEYFDYICEQDSQNCSRDDFTFLQDLMKVYQIDISGNNVQDLSFLSDHPALEQLVLDHNPIRSIAPLKTVKKLKWLEISSCGLSKLEDIEQFPALEYLCAIGNNLDSSQVVEYKELLKSIHEVEF